MKRIDERDVMFSRMGYVKGTDQYKDYYTRHPEHQENDDRLRALPNINGEGTATFNEVISPFADAAFEFLYDIKNLSERQPAQVKVEATPEEMTYRIKQFARYLGAVDVGITKMEEHHYYSVRGRREDTYGKEVGYPHKYGIAFTVEMDRDMINRAPQLEEMIAVTKGYVDAAIIGMWLTYYITNLGYEARNNMDGNYLVVAPRVAQDAGLGEIGRANILITKEQGMRVRIGVVTTNLELIPDQPIDLGIRRFCELCGKCSMTCPGKAIAQGDAKVMDDFTGWRMEQEKCYEVWRKVGTDCGVCLSVCPFSQVMDPEQVEKIKESDEVIKGLLEAHNEKYGIRNYIREKLDIVK